MFLVFVLLLLFLGANAQADAPYPQSTFISGINFDFANRQQAASGSDNWPVTWATVRTESGALIDGQYTSWGDGGGFGGNNSDGRVSLGVGRIEGDSAALGSWSGFNVWGGKNPENPATFNGKTYGIISFGSGNLYMWWTPGSNNTGYTEAKLAMSIDYGATWTLANWGFRQSEGMVMPTILQFAKDYSGLPAGVGNYVYSYFISLKDSSALKVQIPGEIYLVRQPRSSFLDGSVMNARNAQYFSGFDASGNPIWSADIAQKQAVFTDPNGVGWNLAVTYNPGLRRYLLTTEHTSSAQGNLGIFDAPNPWGPWTTAGYYTNWGGLGSTFFWNFSNKWTSPDGKDAYLVFTGTGTWDSFNLVKTIFSLALPQVPKYGVYEVTLTASGTYANPYTQASVFATFQGPTQTINLEGFWDGGDTWKIRMAPTETGAWTYITTSTDSGLNNQTGSFIAGEPTQAEISANEVLRHGFIKVNPVYPHTFMYADGTPFFLMGDTAWPRAFVNGSIYQSGQFQQMVDTRASQGFNVFTVSWLGALSTNIGNRGNEGGTASWTGDRPVCSFYQAVDQRIAYMTSKGTRPMILIGDGSVLTSDQNILTKLQRYHIARWAAYDIIWLGVKEYEEWGTGAVDSIRAIGNTIKQYDPYQHPSSTHALDSTNELGNDTWLDFNSHQSRELNTAKGGRGTGPGAEAILQDYNSFSKPVVQTEAFYEETGLSCQGGWHGYTDPRVLLEGIWKIQLYGGWNVGYQLQAGCDNLDMAFYLNNINSTSAVYHTYLKRFFENTEFWKLVPSNNLVTAGTAWAAAQPGKEYVAFLKDGGSLTLNLAGASGIFAVSWYNPRDGSLPTSAGTISAGGSQTFTAPDTQDWVVHLTLSGIPGDVNADHQVNVLDIQACVNHILGGRPEPGNNPDVNGDGSVNVLDVQNIVNIILGV